ncbi:hypothetical protein E3N88_26304 [Mikania micrantha]|uniref:Uncharacterized protein n=1 Tax=Mikania micrantha TaxID=192012 RepID=A0A5N6N775_9ASTR|nr:hypothetical protein E3N88_26304 [Mikania micrantha]
MEEGKVLKNGIELVKSVSDKHLDLLRPSSRLFSMFKGRYLGMHQITMIEKKASMQLSVIMISRKEFTTNLSRASVVELDGFRFGFPLMWYYATFLYLGNYYRKDPRERGGLAASAIAAMGCSVILFIVAAILLF